MLNLNCRYLGNISSLLMLCFGLILSCKSNVHTDNSTSDMSGGIHKIVVQQVIQTSQYTYLRVKENEKENWLALPGMDAKAGEVYYYTGGLVMANFKSKELDRTFDQVVFLQKVSTSPTEATDTAIANTMPAIGDTSNAYNQAKNDSYKKSVTAQEKKDVKVQTVKGGISIAELYAQNKKFAGKSVKICGQVTKYTPSVMGKNWIHIQDGTEHDGKYDLTITSATEVSVGDVVTFEGAISLDKDLGYGYFFEVIMENATLHK